MAENPTKLSAKSEQCTDDGDGNCAVCGQELDLTWHDVKLPDGTTDRVQYAEYHRVNAEISVVPSEELTFEQLKKRNTITVFKDGL